MDKKVRYVPYVSCEDDDMGPLFWEQYEFSSNLLTVSSYCASHSLMPKREAKPMAVIDVDYLDYLMKKAGEL